MKIDNSANSGNSVNILSPQQPSQLTRWRMPLAGLFLVVAIGGGWMMYAKDISKNAKSLGNADTKKEVIYELAPVDVTKITTRSLMVNLPISGSLMPVSQVTVRSKVAAEVHETLVQEGMPVRKGQIIARFDGADLHARLSIQDAAVDEAQARLALAQKNRHSNEALLKQSYISQNAFDTTQSSLDLAHASLKSALSQREVAQIAVADTQIKSPVDGIISKRSVQAGDKVSPDTALFNIVNLAQLILEAQVPASEIPRVKIGQNVSFAVDGFGTRSFIGKVARINPSAEAGSRSMLVYVEVDNADGALRGGMFAKGNLTLEKTTSYPVMPLAAIRQQNGSDVVYKIVGNQVQQQAVKLGLRSEDEGLVQVLQGLEPGVQVISAKLDSIKPGSKILLPKTANSAEITNLAPDLAPASAVAATLATSPKSKG
ncbi:efflux RND transporter periplasmic adaptor subunit [Undibacterium sp. RTI2.1]|uniref:efflux RND transporter periplasmic adaptor subunit n=1 Tax=unclassified Undibacterium TaxID=2630295 RepID=UPI002AB5D951|nr:MULTISPECIES: efflux RND transporter periplasmic adaptor subunit [unclassified Undibacterium]MDY7538906.1 efflux RND transporter periplasmic adaptor subunit [Undibacterium sp. 5I1]MEB0030844.1 efflux RND transporter periplasmic adaptor subunit [Undibacterium sp. RTI2.1]MEB0117313.1 efflux RND transporter periplasmic adaptor subunit [Undibacterium sp. RTI2.2]MEB0231030.1 efflux RND transporter periplasmic adaptor subunit [Undibacterium sp. 10I3]MEB0257787.1 efflux RND transporter periplasmic